MSSFTNWLKGLLPKSRNADAKTSKTPCCGADCCAK